MIFKDTLVVTATLGNRKSIHRTINSVKLIGGDRVKHVIITPLNNVESLKIKYPFVTVLGEPENCNGIYPALNFALKKYAKDHKYLTYINDDDYWLPNFKILFNTLVENPTLEAVYGKTCYVDDNNNFIGEQSSSPRYKAFKALISQNIVLFTQQATLIKSDLFLELGGFDESFKLIADTNFWIQAINVDAKFKFINKICAAYMIQEGQLSSNGILQNQEHKKMLLDEEYKMSLASLFENFLFRLFNFKLYAKRLLKNKKIIKTNTLFHKKNI
jgi:GT2 family glycosyltransferase